MSGQSPLEGFLEKEVADWNDDIKAMALFKAFAGQRQDYEGRLEFWKNLIVKAAGHLDAMILDAEEVQHVWFSRHGLSPLCLKDVLVDMVNSGELLRMEALLSSRKSSLTWAMSQLRSAFTQLGLYLLSTSPDNESTVGGTFVVTTLLQERIARIIKSLSQVSWSSSCITTMEKFVDLCGGEREADVSLSYLLSQRSAQYFVLPGDDQVQGLKISLVQGPVGNVSKTDHHILQLLFTREKLEQRLILFDKRILQFRESAIISLKRGEKHIALRHLRCMKNLSRSRDNCANFSQRIEEVLATIADAETTKKVLEAIEIGNSAFKDHQVTLDDVDMHLEQLEQSALLQRDIEDAIGSVNDPIIGIDDFEIEEEFASLQAELQDAPLRKENVSAEQDTMVSGQSILPATVVSTSNVKPVKAEEVQLVSKLSNMKLEPA